MKAKRNSSLIQLSCRIVGIDPDMVLEWLTNSLKLHASVVKKPRQHATAKIYLKDRLSAKKTKKQLQNLSTTSFQDYKTQSIPTDRWEKRWKKGLRKVVISKQLSIQPSWIRHKKKSNETIVHIDPGMAFGTGYHPTTHMCLTWIDQHAPTWTHVCDIGCGSGILSLSAVKRGAQYALAFDKDPLSINVALHNIKLNRLSHRITLQKNTVKSLRKKRQYDAVFANLNAYLIKENWEKITSLVKTSHGLLILAGIYKSQNSWFAPWLKRKKNWKIMEEKHAPDWVGYLLENRR